VTASCRFGSNGTPTWSTRVTPSASSSFHSFRSTSSTPSWIVWASTWARSTWANRARSSSASTRRCTTSVWALAHTSARSFAVRLRKLSYSAASRRYLSFSSANSLSHTKLAARTARVNSPAHPRSARDVAVDERYAVSQRLLALRVVEDLVVHLRIPPHLDRTAQPVGERAGQVRVHHAVLAREQ